MQKNAANWHNEGVDGKIIFSLLFSFGFLSPGGSQQAVASELIYRDSEYQQMLEELNRQYEGFYLHQQEQKRWDAERKKGIPAVKLERTEYLRQLEAARKAFVREPPPDMEPARLRWEAEQKKLEAIREQVRRAFVKKRDEIEKVRNSARKIPANEELGLQ